MGQRRLLVGGAGAIGLMLALQLIALWLLIPFDEAGYEAVDDPTNPVYGALFVVVIIVATGGMLLAFKYDLQALIRGGIIFIAGLLTWYVAAALTPTQVLVELGGVDIDLLSLAAAVAVVVALVYHPEWYVIDVSAIIVGAGAAALFGLSFTVLPILVLLVILAVYDAISVYGTKHMLTLAEGAMSMRLPVLLIIPLSTSFTTTRIDEAIEEQTEDTEETEGDTSMDAIFLGLGDLVIPSILIVSAAAAQLGDPVVTLGGLGLGPEVLGGMLGSLSGLVALLVLVFRGRAHAGLPLLNGGVIIGYLLGALVAGISLSAAVGL